MRGPKRTVTRAYVEMKEEENIETTWKKTQAKKEKEAWHASMLKKGVTCERHVLR